MAWKVQKYIKANGKCPFDKWMTGLTAQDRAAIDAKIEAIQVTDVIPPETVKLYKTTNLHEIKIRSRDKKQLRPLCEKDEKTKTITIFYGGIEKDMIPKGDIETSENLMADFKAGEGSVTDY
jgi:histidinol phosphatase-like PHP family hydrolase